MMRELTEMETEQVYGGLSLEDGALMTIGIGISSLGAAPAAAAFGLGVGGVMLAGYLWAEYGNLAS